MPSNAFVTLITTESYLVAVLTLAHTLRNTQSKYPLICMITEQTPPTVPEILAKAGIQTKLVKYLTPKHDSTVQAFARFADTWTKLACFQFFEYDRLVFLDADTVVRSSIDGLMEMELPEDHLAASHVCACNPMNKPNYPEDWIPANCPHTYATEHAGQPPSLKDGLRTYGLLNSGVFVFHPRQSVAAEVFDVLENNPITKTFKFPDQDLLSYVFNKGNRLQSLPYIYNALKPMRWCHSALWNDEKVKIVHYILDKPWEGQVQMEAIEPLHQWWWDAYEGAKAEWQQKGLDGWNVVEKDVKRAMVKGPE